MSKKRVKKSTVDKKARLSREELLELESIDKDIRISELGLEKHRLVIESETYRFKLLQQELNMVKNELNRLNADVKTHANRIAERKSSRKQFYDKIKEKYNLKDVEFGFNPDSGEIIFKE